MVGVIIETTAGFAGTTGIAATATEMTGIVVTGTSKTGIIGLTLSHYDVMAAHAFFRVSTDITKDTPGEDHNSYGAIAIELYF